MKKQVVVAYADVSVDTDVQIGGYSYQILSLNMKRSDFRSSAIDPGELVELEATIAVDWILNSLACRDRVRETASIKLTWADPIWGPKRWQITGSAEFIDALKGVVDILSEEEVKEPPKEGKKAPAPKKPAKKPCGTALEALADVFRQHDIVLIAHHDVGNNATSLEIQAGGTTLIQVDIVGNNALITKHDLGIGVGLSRD